jgi:hypothetical protein
VIEICVCKRPPVEVRTRPPFPLEDGPGLIGGRLIGTIRLGARARNRVIHSSVHTLWRLLCPPAKTDNPLCRVSVDNR